MSRQMRRRDVAIEQVVTVHSHAMTRNGWEYFFLDSKPDSDKNMLALVMGFETEMGDVHLPEIERFMLSFTRDLHDLMPCEGWEWVE